MHYFKNYQARMSAPVIMDMVEQTGMSVPIMRGF